MPCTICSVQSSQSVIHGAWN